MLEIITGPMFSGKSEELTRRLRRAKIAGKSVFAFKPAIDDRYEQECIASHSSIIFSAKSFTDYDDFQEQISEIEGGSIIGIDEAQFLPLYFADYAEELVTNYNQTLIISGLDTDYLGRPFGPMPALMAMADSVIKLSAICVARNNDGIICGKPATKTYRAVDNSNGAVIQVGAAESYQARCRDCWNQKNI